jgi:hypothetical protein
MQEGRVFLRQTASQRLSPTTTPGNESLHFKPKPGIIAHEKSNFCLRFFHNFVAALKFKQFKIKQYSYQLLMLCSVKYKNHDVTKFIPVRSSSSSNT